MLNLVGRLVSRLSKGLCIIGVLSASLVWASVGGSISGTVKDPSGRVVANADITIREINTGISHHAHADSRGYFTLPVLPFGRYELKVQAPGFRGYQRKDIVLDTNAALTLNASLEVGSASETVSVNDDKLHVETIGTDLGQV